MLPTKVSLPLSVEYSPHMRDCSESLMNPFLGYANCPLIGRYNKGEYKIG